MFTIDTHTHIIPKQLPDFAKQFGYGDFIQLDHHQPNKAWMMQGNKRFREIEANCWEAQVRLEDMQKHGIHQQVICTIPVLFSYWAQAQHGWQVSQFLNDDIANTVSQHPNQFIGLATLPMQDVTLAIKELERCMQLGFKGIQIGSNVNNKNLSEPEFFELWAACESLNAAVLIHPWQMMGQEHTSKYWLPWLVGMPAEISRAACSLIFGGVMEKFKNLKVCLAHGGGSFISTIGRIEHGWECRPDLVAIDNPINPRHYLQRFWYDSHVCDHQLLQYTIDVVGANRLMQGSDYPFPLGEAIPGELVRTAPISEADKKLILGDVPKAWLGIQ